MKKFFATLAIVAATFVLPASALAADRYDQIVELQEQFVDSGLQDEKQLDHMIAFMLDNFKGDLNDENVKAHYATLVEGCKYGFLPTDNATYLRGVPEALVPMIVLQGLRENNEHDIIDMLNPAHLVSLQSYLDRYEPLFLTL